MNEFTEVEHKFLLTSDDSTPHLAEEINSWKPESFYSVQVKDHYYLTEAAKGYIYRHRQDEILNQLTVKNLASDNQCRFEVNLSLAKLKADSSKMARAFLEPLGILWDGLVLKDVQVFYFPDCEIVIYLAKHLDHELRCLEFEARHPANLESALATIQKYEDVAIRILRIL